MSKIDVVRAAMVQAMKAKDKARKDSLSMLLSALKNAEIDKREPLTEAEEDAIVKKEIRQTQETYDLAPADRDDIREEAGCLQGICTGRHVCRPDQRSDRRCIKRTGDRKSYTKGQRRYYEGTDAKGKGKSRWQGCQRNSGCYAEVIAE